MNDNRSSEKESEDFAGSHEQPQAIDRKTLPEEGQLNEDQEAGGDRKGSPHVMVGIFFLVTALTATRQHYSRFMGFYVSVGVFCAAMCFLGYKCTFRILSTGRFGRVCKYGLSLGAIFPALTMFVYVTRHIKPPEFDVFAASGVLLKLFTTLDTVGIGPITEELLFRGFFYSTLRTRYGVFPAALLSSLFFAMAHPVGMEALIFHFIRGLIFTWAYQKSGSIWGGIVAHSMNNVPGFLFIWRLV